MKYKKILLLGLCIVLFGYLAYLTIVPKSYFGSLLLDSGYVYNIDLAEFFYRESVRYDRDELNRPEPYVLYQLGRIAFLRGDFEQAYKHLYKELDYYPENSHTYYTLGLVYGYDKQEEKAIEAFRKFIDYMPGSWAARNDMAWLQFRIGDIEGALETIEPAAEYALPNPWVFNTYGVLLMNLGDLEGAHVALLKAATLTEEMQPADWGRAYPGNHPAIHDEGLDAMKESIASNLKNIEGRLASSSVDSMQ